jgi:hypothetical protein
VSALKPPKQSRNEKGYLKGIIAGGFAEMAKDIATITALLLAMALGLLKSLS